MPICNKTAASPQAKNATEINDHASEAAKVKRTREQAYFNSYNFDAIEVLPYDEGEEDQRADDQRPRAELEYTASSNGGKSTIPYQHTLPRSPSDRRRLQNASLSSKSNSSSSRRSSHSSNESCPPQHAPAHHNELKYAYLQRLGAFFINANGGGAARPPAAAVTVPNSNSVQVHASAVEDGNGNFLLPRAMLKYQSVGITNSMPLAVISVAHAAGKDKLLQNTNSSSNITTNNHNNNGQTMMSNTNTNVNGKSGTTLLSKRSAGTTRLGYTNGANDGTGFLEATTTAADKDAVARNKKQSTSSTTTSTASIVSVEHELDKPASKSTPHVRNHIATKTKTAGANDERRGRTSSHQSHYSTDKSGSSGYYSSNVCSTYSLEDHIYCEPVIDILVASSNSNSKSVVGAAAVVASAASSGKASALQAQPADVLEADKVETLDLPNNSSHMRDMNGVGQSKRRVLSADADDEGGAAGDEDEDEDEADGRQAVMLHRKHDALVVPFSENLRVLETSIENLDRHLKNYPSLSSHDRIASFVQSHHHYHAELVADKLRNYNNLPTIMEGYDPAHQPRPWQDDIADDSLLDIDLDSFLLVDERRSSKRNHQAKTAPLPVNGIDNPSFLADELEENNYKCAKYINSCPEDAYRVESDIAPGTGNASVKSVSMEHFLKRYEDQLHFQNTRELLEDVRDKIRMLSHTSSELHSNSNSDCHEDEVPKELEGMITTLKVELESYLSRMNQHSELEIRQLCSGLVKSHHIVRMQKAFERRRSTHSLSAGIGPAALPALNPESRFPAYEAIRDGVLVPVSGVPITLREQLHSIRCASDPNFKMKRKSLTEVFPVTDCYVETTTALPSTVPMVESDNRRVTKITQLQRNLSFQQPVLNQLDTKVGPSGSNNGLVSSGAESGESADKDSILEWHRKKPSIWEMYYGTNRMNQSLLGKRNGMVVNSNQATMSYPSSRPESDFTLDLPRAEQLRIKMEKEKKFRQRCRYITTFLSLIFFLLTVMVVSLVLSRGKRMFGSMI